MGSHWVYAVFSSEALSGLCGVWNIEIQEKKKKKPEILLAWKMKLSICLSENVKSQIGMWVGKRLQEAIGKMTERLKGWQDYSNILADACCREAV